MMTFENGTVPSVLHWVVKSNLIFPKAFNNFFSLIFISDSYYLIGCQDVDDKSTRIVRLAGVPLGLTSKWSSETFSLQSTPRL